MKRVCLGCRAIFDIPALKNGRCLPCRATRERVRNGGRAEERALYNSGPWKALRRRVVDAADRCHWCGAPSSSVKLTADHVLTIRMRPDLALDESNVVAACRSCQLRRQYTPGGGRSS